MKQKSQGSPLASLLSKLVDGRITEEETTRLEEILRQNPAARAHYRQYVATHFDLNEILPQIEIPQTPRWFRRSSVLLPIAASIALIAGAAFFALRSAPPVSAAAHGPVLAVTKASKDVRWSLKKSPKVGINLSAGRVELTAGTLALTMRGGQVVTLAAPSDFELIDETEVFLHRGIASLRIIGESGPFGIRMPRGKVLDLGTEFAVNVAPDGTADVWVFEGKALVSLTAGTSPAETQSLTAGQSVRIGETLTPSPAKPVDFIRPLLDRDGGINSSSDVIARFSEEFPSSTLGSGQPFGGTETPARGWAYLWNPTGTLGNSASYQPLSPNTVNTFPAADGGGIYPMFTRLSDLPFNSTGQEIFQFGRIAKTSIHPGKYIKGKDYRAIIAYTIQPDEAGEIRITNSSLAKHRIDGFVTNGVDLDIFVNDTLMAALGKDGFDSLNATSFDGSLGTLAPGDTVYITLGNNGDDGHGHGISAIYDAFDACVIDFQLEKAP
jgi:ferric-dicitrate binding protein FerR (iron transport regulator)